jgi:hypothetical protein
MKPTKQYATVSAMLLLVAVATSCPGTRWDVSLSAQKTKLYKTNLVGITGVPSSEPYVEIIYSIDDGQGKNKTESLLVSPPYVFQNSKVNITYDSVVYARKERDEYYQLTLKRNYGEGGADYFRIVNHSTDKTVEFFLAGAQDVKETDSKNENGVAEAKILPSVYYRNAPIYYLLYPDKKYHRNLTTHEVVFYFEGNRCGDLELTSAWSVDDVMQLYRAEYRRSPDTLLYVDIRGAHNGGRMTNNPIYSDPRLENRTFYGVIPPGGQFKGDENFWLPATPWIFEEMFQRGDY